MLFSFVIIVCTLSACSSCPVQETLPEETYEMTMLCSFSGGTTESRTSHVSGYSYGADGGYVSGTAHYTVDAEHYYVVCEMHEAYFLIDFGSNITTFMLAANKSTFNILAAPDELFGTQYQYYYCSDKNPKKSENRVTPKAAFVRGFRAGGSCR